jgi:rhodanese-related sulfurtransferase
MRVQNWGAPGAYVQSGRPGVFAQSEKCKRPAFVAAIVSAFVVATVAGCGRATPDGPAKQFSTEYGLGPDKWATAWLLTRRVEPGSRLVISAPGGLAEDGVRFDVPTAEIRRVSDRSAFEVAKVKFSVEDPVVDALAAIVHEIEINFWTQSGPPEAQAVEEAFRALQYRYGRDSVTPECYVAFFDRVYQVLKDSRGNPEGIDPERLQLGCDELTHLAQRGRDLIPEVPVVDVLSAAAAGHKVIFVDVREPDEYFEGHIPGALNIPLRDVRPELRARLDGADYVVSYCVKDFRGFEMAKALANLGIRNSVIMRPYGIKGWAALGLPISGSKGLTEEQAGAAFQRCLENTSECLGASGGAP